MQDLPLSINGNTAIDVAVTAIKKAGDYVRKNISSAKVVSSKGFNNLVSSADFQSEKIIVDKLKSEYPEWDIISEESYPDNAAKSYSWIIDPIDGTTNFIHNLPFISINIALKYKDDIKLGVTYDPLRKELFYAQKGEGSFLNGKKLKVSNEYDLGKSVICCDLGYDSGRGLESLQTLQNLWGHVLCFRIVGSAALGLAYVACGRVNLYFHNSVYPWDIASGILLINEAGGEVKQWKNQNDNDSISHIIASNKELNKQFINYFPLS
jgi:myo-inositol-1(or 4)-monophosphatase